MTTVCIFRGSTEPSAFCRYSMVTWVLPSGRSHHNLPLLRTSVSFLPRRVATRWVRGMQSSVSSLAYPNMMPWSPHRRPSHPCQHVHHQQCQGSAC